MRSNLPRSEFFKKMKKKPALQAILDNLDNYTSEQLEWVDQPKWIREELQNLKLRDGQYASQTAEALAAQMEHEPVHDNTKHDVYKYEGPEDFFETKNSGQFSFEIQLSPGDTYIVVSADTIRSGDHQNVLTNGALWKLYQSSVHVDKMTLDTYRHYHRQQINMKHGNPQESTESDQTKITSQDVQHGWFRIQRH